MFSSLAGLLHKGFKVVNVGMYEVVEVILLSVIEIPIANIPMFWDFF
jgi:hypothetical protein